MKNEFETQIVSKTKYCSEEHFIQILDEFEVHKSCSHGLFHFSCVNLFFIEFYNWVFDFFC